MSNDNDRKNLPRNVVAYTRADCGWRESRLNAQLERIRKWISAKNLPWKIVITYRDESSGIQNAIQDIRRVLAQRGIDADTIVVESFSRLGRDNVWRQLDVMGEFEIRSTF